ncbi:MAG: biotin--[acetyl-CoA-carboxylase] ligase [Actinomycetota bacterium]
MEMLRRPLDNERINSALNNSYWRVSVVDVTGSTQNDLAVQIREGNSGHGNVLVAEFQSAGRGRLDRSFVAPPQSALLFSFFIKPLRDSADWLWLPLLAGQAVCAAIESQCRLDVNHIPKLKWPNDILMNEKKIAGLLSERIDHRDGAGVIIGIGINVHLGQDELPVSTASALNLQGCSGCNRDELLVAILQNFTDYLERWESGDVRLVREYEARSATIGRQIRVESPTGTVRESTAIGIDPSGALILTTGELLTVGDVVHLNTD